MNKEYDGISVITGKNARYDYKGINPKFAITADGTLLIWLDENVNATVAYAPMQWEKVRRTNSADDIENA